ncbi:MAG: tetratricopeptide repeat protein, partial [Proteobacteria bacterium]
RLKGAAAYRAEDYPQAIEHLRELEPANASDYYNLGNALAQAGDLEAALEHYERALTIEPDDEDTLYNKDIVEQALKQQQKQSDSNQEQSQDSEQQNNPESEQQDGDGQDQSNQEQQDQDGQPGQEQQDQESQQQKQQAQKDAAKESNQQDNDEQSSEQNNNEQQELSPEQQQQQAEDAERLAQQEALNAEEQQAIEQWLRRIQDDPGGLMRRKFLYQYHRRNPDGEAYDNQTTEDW